MVSPSVSSSITARLEVQARPTAVSELTTAIEKAGGIVTALDVTASGHEQMTVDVTCATRGEQHAADIVEALKGLHGVVVERVSDRTVDSGTRTPSISLDARVARRPASARTSRQRRR